MQNSMLMFTFLFLSGNTHFGQIWSQIQISLFEVKLGNYTKSNMYNSMVMFTFSIFDQNYPFCVELI